MTNLNIVAEAIAHTDSHAMYGGRIGTEKTCLLLVDGKTVGVRVLPISVDYIIFDDLSTCPHSSSLFYRLGYRRPTEEELETAKREWREPKQSRSNVTNIIDLYSYNRFKSGISVRRDHDLTMNTTDDVIEHLRAHSPLFREAKEIREV